MDIREWIKFGCKEGYLHPIDPLIPTDPIKRKLFVSNDVWEKLNGPWRSDEEEAEWFTMRAVMESFVSGRVISVAANPRRNRPHHTMGLLHPPKDGVWELRATRPKPGIRALGNFGEKDMFLAFVWQQRNILGNFGSREWRDFILDCQTTWRTKFAGYKPFIGGAYEDYISNIIIE